jgi:hypothetical protein
MTHFDDTYVLANHWPVIDRSILWRQALAHRRALTILAEEQADSHGFPVPLGRKRLFEIADISQGEATAIINALGVLSYRGVVARDIQRGSRPTMWSLNPDVTRWRSIRFIKSARDLEASISSCICVTPLAIASKFPDEGSQLRHSSRKFRVYRAHDHLRSGNLPVELRRYREDYDAIDEKTGGEVVELRRNRERVVTPLYIAGSSKEELSKDNNAESNYRNHRLYKEAVASVTEKPFSGKLFGDPFRRICACIDAWNDDQVDFAVAALNDWRARGVKLGTVTVADRIEGLVEAAIWPKSEHTMSLAEA